MGGAAADTGGEARLWSLLAGVPDPEIPVLSIVDLGIVRFVRRAGDAVVVGVAPTYSGCPATEVIEASVVAHLQNAGLSARVERVLSPPWTTAWITDEGRRKLLEYGIVPPRDDASKRAVLGEALPLACPRCDSVRTDKVSEFGSTPCKALYKCLDCKEPFEYFKCL